MVEVPSKFSSHDTSYANILTHHEPCNLFWARLRSSAIPGYVACLSNPSLTSESAGRFGIAELTKLAKTPLGGHIWYPPATPFIWAAGEPIAALESSKYHILRQLDKCHMVIALVVKQFS